MGEAAARKVSVIIPTWQRGDLLRRCLDSLRRQTFSDFAIVLVSNGAGKWVEQLAAEFSCEVRSFPDNRGFAAAVNAGIAVAQSRYVALLNDDAELGPAWLERMTGLLDERPEISFCCGKIYQAGAVSLDNVGDAISMGGSAWRLGFGRKDSGEFDCARPLIAVSGTAALFRRQLFDELGGLDPNFFSYLEDLDFSLRAARAGFQGLYLPQATAQHHGGATLGGADSPIVFRLLTRNQLLLLVKHYPWPLLFRLAPRIAWAQLLWALMAVRKGRTKAYLAGMAQFLGMLPKTIRKRPAWRSGEWRARLSWLRESEAAIYADISTRERSSQDAFWRLYFLLFPPRRNPAAAPKEGLGRLPSR